MRADERGEDRTALFDRGELVGAGLVEVREVARERCGEVRRAVAQVGGLLGELGRARGLRRARARGGPRRAATPASGASPSPDSASCAVGRGQAQLLGVRETLGARAELDVLARLRRRLLDLGELLAQSLGLGGARVAIAGQLGELALDRARVARRRSR